MEMNQPSNRIHPLMAGAAVSVILVSLVGIAAITGVLPNSHSAVVEPARMPPQAAAVASISAPAQQVATAPAERDEGARHKTVTRHHHVQQARAESVQQYSQAPAYQQPAPIAQPVAQPVPQSVAQNSPVGIGIGAVVGGLLGHQVGGGNGKTLATIAGAVGGGYLGNEIAKRYP